MANFYLDTETCGLHGAAVILQYAIDSGPIVIYEFWVRPVQESLTLLEEMCQHTVVGFNLTFDWFHLQKMYNMLSLIEDKTKPPTIKEMVSVEMNARDGLCLKPAGAIDLMLHYRKNEMQMTMDRKDITIRRVPASIAPIIAGYLNKQVKLDPILFAKAGKGHHRFQVVEREDDYTLADIKLKFKPSMSLKTLAKRVLGHKTTIDFGDISAGFYPKEFGYAPFAKAVLSEPGKLPWHQVIQHHIDHWTYNEQARVYATNDVIYTRELHLVSGAGVCDDSVLACCVASCRWKGYAVDLGKVKELRDKCILDIGKTPMSPAGARSWIGEVITPIEEAILSVSTNKAALEALSALGGPASERAAMVLKARRARKMMNTLDKLTLAGRLHASFKVIGTLSNRMSGADSLNTQGMERSKEFRSCFPLAFPGEALMAGDLDSFEITIAEAIYKDPELRKQLCTCTKCGNSNFGPCEKCGGKAKKSFHGLFGMGFYKMTYEQLMATKGTLDDKYTPSKVGGFATLYGALPFKLSQSMSIDLDDAKEGFAKFWRTYPIAGRQRQLVIDDHTGLRDPMTYVEPAGFAASMLGFKRFFNIENSLIKSFWAIASNPPQEWNLPLTVLRSKEKGVQSVLSATRSALFGAAFSIQNGKIRQAANHQIQSTGAGINKVLQVKVWELQPVGAHKWCVRPMNIHDELQCPTTPELADAVKAKVTETVNRFKELIPLISIDFGRFNSWADK